LPFDPDILVPISLFAMIAVVAVGTPLVRALARRWDREVVAPRVPAEISARLERMEHAIDAMAVELERIAEGQRFMTKVFAERPREAARLVGPGDGSV
jgi:hypothetical protein